MQIKRSIIKTNAVLYHKAARKLKTQVLDELRKTTHFSRKHLTTLLNNTGKVCYTPQGIKLVGDPTVTYTHRRGRKKKYTQELVPFLKACWVVSGYRCSVHLKVFIEQNRDWLLCGLKQQVINGFPKRMREDLQVLAGIPAAIQEQLLNISSATMDRLLRPVKDQEKLVHKYRSHPHASALKKQIPIETNFDKPRGRLGYTELDTVHHCGLSTKGSYCCTLSEVEINTHWTELRALKNKAHHWVYQALQANDKVVPFKIHNRHVDNGSEFINQPVFAYTQAQCVRYTRSRAYHKNDNPVVEGRHWTLIRCYVGYRCYDTEAEYQILTELMPLISLKHNYFMPTMRTIEKVRVGGKVRKRYEIDTPYNRILKSSQASAEKKQELSERKVSLSYLEILQKIIKLQLKLDQAYRMKYNPFPEDEE